MTDAWTSITSPLMYPPFAALGLLTVNDCTPMSIVGAILESAAETTSRLAVWSPLNKAATVRKLSAAVLPPPARTVEIGTDHDLVTGLPADSVTDSNPVPALFRSHFFQTW